MANPADNDSPAPAPDRGGHDRGNTGVMHAALWAAASQYCLFLLQFITSVIISRFFLLPEEVGLFSVALAAAMILSIVQDFGLTRYIGRHPKADEAMVRSCTVIAILFSFILVLLIIGIAWPVTAFYSEPRLGPILVLIGLSYLFAPWSIVPLALIARRLDFRRVFLVNFSGALANSMVALGLAALGFSAESLAWAMIAQSVMRAITAQIAQPTPIRLPLRLTHLRDILGFGSASSVLYLSGGIGMRTPDMIVGRMLGMAPAGLFSRGSALASHLHMLVTGAVSSIYYPAFARLRDEGADLGPYYERVVAAHGAIVWPAMILLAVLAEPVVLLLYGEAWVEAAPLLALVAIAECFFAAAPLHMDLPILLGRIRQLIFVNFADTALSVLTLIAGAMIGLQEAAASRIAYGLGWLLLYVFWLQRMVRFSWPAMLRIYFASAAVAVVTALPAIHAVTIWRTPATLGLDGMMAAASASALAWMIAVLLLRHPARNDLASLAMHAFGPILARLRTRPA
ncbi:MAG: oligosaccharide flippase family protein [Novosphingobium sp.]|nr:oligosaccharide flippase family protein [Novosphingobium sp.]